MKKSIVVVALMIFLGSFVAESRLLKKEKWISLFDGNSLNGWKVGAHPETFKVEDGAIVVNGNVAHLFYNGPVMNHEFKNFEFKAKVMTFPGSNSGLYFHTEYQDKGWPTKGYEVQVNNSHTDWKRTGSLYSVQDVREVYVKDNEWYTESITVKGKRVIIKINNKTVVDYTEPEKVQRSADMAGESCLAGLLPYKDTTLRAKYYLRT